MVTNSFTEPYTFEEKTYQFVALSDVAQDYIGGQRSVAKVTKAIERLSDIDCKRMVRKVYSNKIADTGRPAVIFVSEELLAQLKITSKTNAQNRINQTEGPATQTL